MRSTTWARVGPAAWLLAASCYGGVVDVDGDEMQESSADDGTGADDGIDESGDDTAGDPVECDGELFDPGPNLVRRLTVREYANTIEAVLGVDVRADATAMLPAETRADGFTNTASGLITTLEHIESYEALAELAVTRMPDLASFVQTYTSCTDFTDACEREYVESLGRVVFRRPLVTEEIEWLMPGFAIAQSEGESFQVGAGLVLEAMLQSPAFLYRLEDETTGASARKLDGYEIASRLSYLLWSGPPDAVLFDAAAADALDTDDELVAQVDRMLADPRAREASVAFVHDWLHLSRLEHLPRDPERFPGWSTAIGHAMRDETSAFFESVAWDQNRALVDLHDAQETWLTAELAQYYGLESAGPGLVLYDLASVPERGGLLTQGSLLTIGGDNSSMVGRGLFVLETLLCGALDSPPAGVDTTPPPIEPGKSQRDYSEERTSNPSCLGCHRQMEPFAWGLERFLADGTYRTEDWLGNELREDGFLQLPGVPEELPYDDVAGMVELIAGSDQAGICFALKGTQYAIGRTLLPTDSCSIDLTQAQFAESDGTWRDLVVSIALSPGFRSIRVEQAP